MKFIEGITKQMYQCFVARVSNSSKAYELDGKSYPEKDVFRIYSAYFDELNRPIKGLCIMPQKDEQSPDKLIEYGPATEELDALQTELNQIVI